MNKLLLSLVFVAGLGACSAPMHEKFDPAAVATDPSSVNTVVLDSAGISVSLPKAWQRTPDVYDENPNVILYQFRREPVFDDRARKIIPNFAVFAEDVSRGTDVSTFSDKKRSSSIFAHHTILASPKTALGGVGGLCYISTYDDGPDRLEHRIYLVYSIVGNKGLQIMIDGTESVFDMLSSEYEYILRSLSKIEPRRQPGAPGASE
jgi:hypothetical protein